MDFVSDSDAMPMACGRDALERKVEAFKKGELNTCTLDELEESLGARLEDDGADSDEGAGQHGE